MVSLIACALAVALLDPPDPTPTPTPEPNVPIQSFYVPPQQPPWPVPVFPPFGPGTPQPTFWAATPAHGTEFPGYAATATAQLGIYLGPISGVSTPVAGIIGLGPTQQAGSFDTGVDPVGSGQVTFPALAAEMSTDIVDAIGTAKTFIADMIELGSYSPWLAPVPVVLIAGIVLATFIPLGVMIFKAGWWILGLLSRIAMLLSIVKWLAKIF